MGFTTPATAVAATALTATFLNVNMRDNIAWTATDSPTCRVYNSANLPITTGTVTALTFNSERFDNAAMHSTSSNQSRITIPTGGGGKYLVGMVVEWQNSTAGTYRDNRIRNNGSTYHAGNTLTAAAINNVVILNSPTGLWSYTAADYVEFTATQDTGGNLNVLALDGSPEAWAVWFRT
jgi:hypothetical protein